MKKFILIFILNIFLLNISFSQITLTYETHGLLADYTHQTQYIEGVSQGKSGENQIWDFTNFECSQTKTSELYNSYLTSDYNKFTESNITINDDENLFYFNVNEDVNEYLGLTTPDAIIHFQKPIVKMQYPFTFGDEFSGDFYGDGLYYGEIFSDIYGDYQVTGDGYGTLLLPNNASVENVLRVKSVNHIFETACNTTEFINEKYLWYSEENRFPIMVVIYNTKITENDTVITNFGYYNENAFQSQMEVANINSAEYSVNIYPNPFVDNINISYNLEKESNVTVEIYNPIGQRLEILVDDQMQNGLQTIQYNTNRKSFAVGSYFVRIYIDDKIITKKIIMVD